MTLEYTLTVDDLREAIRPTTPDGRQVPRRGGFVRGVLGWAVFIAMASLLTFVVTSGKPPRPAMTAGGFLPGDWGPPSQNLWVTLTPSLIPAGIGLLFVLLMLGRQQAQVRRATRATAAGLPVPPTPLVSRWAVLVLLSPLALVVVCNAPRLAIPWRPTPGTAMWVGLLPWVAAAMVAAPLLGWVRASAAAWRWATVPALRRRLSADVSDAGVRTSDGVTDTHYRWPAVTRYRETAHLLVLTQEDARVLVLPKRAAADADGLRGLVQTHVAQGTFLPRAAAFPVVAVAGPTGEPGGG